MLSIGWGRTRVEGPLGLPPISYMTCQPQTYSEQDHADPPNMAATNPKPLLSRYSTRNMLPLGGKRQQRTPF